MTKTERRKLKRAAVLLAGSLPSARVAALGLLCEVLSHDADRTARLADRKARAVLEEARRRSLAVPGA